MKRSHQNSSEPSAPGFLFGSDSTASNDCNSNLGLGLFGDKNHVEEEGTSSPKSKKRPKSTKSTATKKSISETEPADLLSSYPTPSNSLLEFNQDCHEASSPKAINIDTTPEHDQKSVAGQHNNSQSVDATKKDADKTKDPLITDEKQTLNIPDFSSTTLEPSSKAVEKSPCLCESPAIQNQPSVKQEPTNKIGSIPFGENKPSSYQVVARRYRPQAFNELIGQETVSRALSNAIETNRVGHAYLFTGARGVGKTSCARIFAKALNCVNGPTIHPCLECDSCVGVATGDDVDVIEIDGASNRGVDEIRLLRQNATIAPTRSAYKIYIIDEVHMLTREAFNALLKTLEEPPIRVKFIFCTTEPNKIPITILSRCQRFDFNGISGCSISERLSQIAQQEGANAEEGVFDILARRANGSMRDAQSLLEQLLSFAPNYISQTDVHNMLGSVDDKKIFDLLEAIIENSPLRAFELLGDSARHGVDFGILTEQVIGVFRDLMVVGSGCGPNELMYAPIARFTELQAIARNLGLRRILASIQILDQTAQHMRVSPQSRILVELAFARLCQLDSFQTIDALIRQLQSGNISNIPLVSSSVSLCNETNLDESKKKIDNKATDEAKVSIPIAKGERVSIPDSNYSGHELVSTQGEQVNTPSSYAHENISSFLQDRSRNDNSQYGIEPIVQCNEHVEQTTAFDERIATCSVSKSENKSSWLSFPENKLIDYWLSVTNTGVILPGHAKTFGAIRTEAPNLFIVVFPKGHTTQKNYCENIKDKLATSLSQRLKSQITLQFLVDSSISKPQMTFSDEKTSDVRDNLKIQQPIRCNSNSTISFAYEPNNVQIPNINPNRTNKETVSSRGNYRELTKEFAQNQVVLELKEFFNAELSDVKPPTPNTTKPRYDFS